MLIAGAAALYTVYALRVGGFQPDEWYFTTLARYTAMHFPSALWEPGIYFRGIQRIDPLVLAAPYAFLRMPAAIEVGHGIQAFLYASAALPVWLLARDAGLSRAARLLAPAICVLSPWAIVSTSFLAEPAAFPAFAWVLYAVFRNLVKPSRTAEALAMVAFVVALFSRTQFLALPVILPVSILWQEHRCPARPMPWRSRLTTLPQRLWARHPIVTVLTAASIVAVIASFTNTLPGGGVKALTGDYGLPALGPLSTILALYRYYLSRMVVGTGVLAAALGLAWVLRTLWRPRQTRLHALAVTSLAGVAGLLLTLVAGGPDERYILYGSAPIALAFAAALQDRRGPRPSTRAAYWSLAAGTAFVVWLITSVTWPAEAAPYDYFTYPAAVFFGHVLLGRLSLLLVPLAHLAPDELAAVLVAIAVCTWALLERSSSLRRRSAYVMGIAVLALCATQLIYSLERFSTSVAAEPGGPSATQRAWVSRALPAGANAAMLATGLGGSGFYAPIWRSIQYWNGDLQRAATFNADLVPPLPFGAFLIFLTPSAPSGRLAGDAGPPFTHPYPVPRFMLVPIQATNPEQIEGRVLAHDPVLPVELVKVAQPPRLDWMISGTDTEGFIEAGATAVATIYSGSFGPGPRCASFELLAPPGFPGHWPYVVSEGARRLAAGRLVAQQTEPVVVPLRPTMVHGGPMATISIVVHGKVPYPNGAEVSAQVLGFQAGACGSSPRP
ncbi:MAG: hypothetical protein ACYDA6_07690 [Solirubrobacteraceae bacterium]